MPAGHKKPLKDNLNGDTAVDAAGFQSISHESPYITSEVSVSNRLTRATVSGDVAQLTLYSKSESVEASCRTEMEQIWTIFQQYSSMTLQHVSKRQEPAAESDSPLHQCSPAGWPGLKSLLKSTKS